MKPLLPPEEIDLIVKRLAKEIRADFASKDPILVCVLKASFILLADLVRALKMPVEVDFMQAESYGKRDVPGEKAVITRDLTADIRDRHVIIVEAIIDRGHTARAICDHLRTKGPASISICTLLLRNGQDVEVKADYVGARIDGGFVVGYGLDHKEGYRGLPGIYIMTGA